MRYYPLGIMRKPGTLIGLWTGAMRPSENSILPRRLMNELGIRPRFIADSSLPIMVAIYRGGVMFPRLRSLTSQGLSLETPPRGTRAGLCGELPRTRLLDIL